MIARLDPRLKPQSQARTFTGSGILLSERREYSWLRYFYWIDGMSLHTIR